MTRTCIENDKQGTVLVTGAHGYLAGRTIAAVIEAGFLVHGTVRSPLAAETVKNSTSRFSDDLETTQIPNITLSGAFDEAMKGSVTARKPPL